MKKSLDKLANEYHRRENNTPGYGTSQIRTQIAECAKPYISKIIQRVNVPSGIEYSYDDLENEAMYMVFKSLDNYNPEEGAKFSTYMYIRVRGRIIQYIRKNDSLTRTQRNRVGEIREARHQLEQEHGRYPSPSEIADHLDRSESDVIRSLQAHNGRESNDLADRVPTPDELDFNPLEAKYDREFVIRELQILPVRDRVLLILYYFLGLTGREISVVLDIVQPYVYRIKKEALEELKKH